MSLQTGTLVLAWDRVFANEEEERRLAAGANARSGLAALAQIPVASGAPAHERA